MTKNNQKTCSRIYRLEKNPKTGYEKLSDLIINESPDVGDDVLICEEETVNLTHFISVKAIEDDICEFATLSNGIFDIIKIPKNKHKDIKEAIAAILSPYAKEKKFDVCHGIKRRTLNSVDFERAGV